MLESKLHYHGDITGGLGQETQEAPQLFWIPQIQGTSAAAVENAVVTLT